MADPTTSSAPRIEEIAFERAEDLLAALRPESPLWAPAPDAWIFRGHADAEWRLLPTAHRRDTLRRFLNGVDKLSGDRRYCEPRVGHVLQLISDFAKALNAAGRTVPVRLPSVTDLDRFYGLGLFSPELEQVAALGQHHGLPTMLLDWTTVGTYAAYFAASGVADLPHDGGRLDVWAFNRAGFSIRGQLGGLWAFVRLIEPLRADNPNLHSQAGLFTLTVLPVDGHQPEGVLKLVTVDEVVRVAVEQQEIIMRRLSLPHEEARKVLRLLAHERVAGTFLFPGVDGVVRSVRDGWQTRDV